MSEQEKSAQEWAFNLREKNVWWHDLASDPEFGFAYDGWYGLVADAIDKQTAQLTAALARVAELEAEVERLKLLERERYGGALEAFGVEPPSERTEPA